MGPRGTIASWTPAATLLALAAAGLPGAAVLAVLAIFAAAAAVLVTGRPWRARSVERPEPAANLRPAAHARPSAPRAHAPRLAREHALPAGR